MDENVILWFFACFGYDSKLKVIFRSRRRIISGSRMEKRSRWSDAKLGYSHSNCTLLVTCSPANWLLWFIIIITIHVLFNNEFDTYFSIIRITLVHTTINNHLRVVSVRRFGVILMAPRAPSISNLSLKTMGALCTCLGNGFKKLLGIYNPNPTTFVIGTTINKVMKSYTSNSSSDRTISKQTCTNHFQMCTDFLSTHCIPFSFWS